MRISAARGIIHKSHVGLVLFRPPVRLAALFSVHTISVGGPVSILSGLRAPNSAGTRHLNGDLTEVVLEEIFVDTLTLKRFG